MKIAIVRGRGIDPSVHKMAQLLSKEGHEVSLLIWDRQLNAEVPHSHNYSVYKSKILAPYDSLLALLYLPLWWAHEFIFLIKGRYDVIHACDIDTVFMAILIKIIKKNRLFYTIYDYYADCLPIWVPKQIRIGVSALDKFFIGFSDVLFLVDEQRLNQIEGARVKKIEYIYNSPPDCNISLEPKKNDMFTIYYAGLIHGDRGICYIIDAVKELNRVKFEIAGTGPDEKNIINMIKENPGNAEYCGFIDYDSVLKKSLMADVIIAFYDPDCKNNRYASPNKLFEAMMCGKPIITNEGTSMAHIVERVNCGIVIPYSNVAALKEAILNLRDNPNLCKELGNNGRRAYEEKYNWKIMEERLTGAYDF